MDTTRTHTWKLYLKLCLLLLLFALAHANNHKRHQEDLKDLSQGNCITVHLPVCKGVVPGEDVPVHLPNTLGHRTGRQVQTALSPFAIFLEDPKCGPQLQRFLCHLVAPPCASWDNHNTSTKAAKPCRSECKAAYSHCRRLMKKKGLTWPSDFQCSKFPQSDCLHKKTSTLNKGIGVASKSENVVVPLKSTQNKAHQAPIQGHQAPIQGHQGPIQGHQALTQEHQAPIQGHQAPIQGHTPGHVVPVSPDDTNLEFMSHNKRGRNVKDRRYDIEDLGEDNFFKGWADVQGQGAANDYCRIIGKPGQKQFLSCRLAGSRRDLHTYMSVKGLDVGHRGTWFMRDMDGDGRDDYCRCVGHGANSQMSCMKAGKFGFYGSEIQGGSQYTFVIREKSPCMQTHINPVIGLALH